MSKFEVLPSEVIRLGHCLAIKEDSVIYSGTLANLHKSYVPAVSEATVLLHPEDFYNLKDFIRKKKLS